MKQLNDKYYILTPNIDNLKDRYILGLAWKKTDRFIRTHNWYADLLSLDAHTLNIENKINNWKGIIENREVTNSSLELILAPKSARWSVDNKKWIQKKEDRHLRCLSDIPIKDQTIATAIMMCIADAIETRQKNCALDRLGYTDHIKKNMVSYGNRLLCDWDGDVARFRWGGSEFYRQYSSDYRAFLKRPISIGRDIKQKISSSDDVYVVHLDLSNFYSSINIELLFKKIIDITNEHYAKITHQPINNDAIFWDVAKKHFIWSWDDESLETATSLDLPSSIGLPQGLACAGAISNAYLIDFDEEIIKELKKENKNIQLHDYCRYVDDLRFVVSGQSLNKREISELITNLVQRILNETLVGDETKDGSLTVKNEKTKVFELSELDNESNLSNRINELQHNIGGASCVTDRNTLDSSIPALQQLLQSSDENNKHGFNSLFPDLNLDSSINEATVHRFSAHRLNFVLQQKRKITPQNERLILENESKIISKKLVIEWLKDPSNMILLRKAMEIYPSTYLYGSIIETISNRLVKNKDKKDKYIMTYLLSDIFRSVGDIYTKLDDEQLIEYSRLISDTAAAAQKILSEKTNLASHIYKQAATYLTILNKPLITKNRKTSTLLTKLHDVLLKKKIQDLNECNAFLFEVAAQITNEYQANAALLFSHSSECESFNKILELYAYRGGKFWHALCDEMKTSNNKSYLELFHWAIPKGDLTPSSNTHYLSAAMVFNHDYFKHEHSLLKLGIAIVDYLEDEQQERNANRITPPQNLKLSITNVNKWDDIWKREAILKITYRTSGCEITDPRYTPPEWLDISPYQSSVDECDRKKIYWICSILRGAAIGNTDYTLRNDLDNNTSKYSGIKTQFFKRQMGMLHTPESIVGSYATVSDWFCHLLQHGLQWPGFASTYIDEEDILSIESLAEFKQCIQNRLSSLDNNTCNSSNVPTLPTIVNRPELDTKPFRVVTVQQLFPNEKHFHTSDVTLSSHNIRCKHRAHLAEICKLTEQTLKTKLNIENGVDNSTADLIVFSELAVHPNDEDLIKALAFRTKAIVFAGFVFTNHKGMIINKARWIIPDNSEFGMQWRIRDQGKFHMTPSERHLGVKGYRPCQHIIEVHGNSEGPFKLTGAICYDATDIRLAADLRDKTDMFVISAHNKDVNTFDSMASALQWHMYQHIIIANTGEFGGSTMQAPYKEKHHKLISHAHGASQIAISTADIDLAAFRRKVKEYKKTKAEPAGFNRNH